jgi:hypothetical protein
MRQSKSRWHQFEIGRGRGRAPKVHVTLQLPDPDSRHLDRASRSRKGPASSVWRLHSVESAVKSEAVRVSVVAETRIRLDVRVWSGDPFINVRQQVGSSGPSAYPPVTFVRSHVRTVATRTGWSGLLCYRKAPGCLLAAGCYCSYCPVSSLAASADARRDHGQDERIHSLRQFARSRTDRTTARGCKARATSRLRDNTLDARRIRSNVLRQRRAPFQVAPSHDEKKGDGTAALDIFAPGYGFPAALRSSAALRIKEWPTANLS